MNAAYNISFSSFLGHNIALFIILLVLIIAYCYFEFKAVNISGYHVSVRVAVNLVNDKKTNIIDIRKSSDYAKGHIADSRNLSEQLLFKNLKGYFRDNNSGFLLIGDKLHSADKVAIALKKKGYKNIKILSGGMRAWVKEQMPIEKGADASSNKLGRSANAIKNANKKKKKLKR